MTMTETIPQSPARSLHDVCESARLVPCGYCWGERSQSCAFTSTRGRPIEGWHLERFARARRKGLITAAEMAAVIVTATGDVFTPGTVIWDDHGDDLARAADYRALARELGAARP